MYSKRLSRVHTLLILLLISVMSIVLGCLYRFNNPMLSRDSCYYVALAEKWFKTEDFRCVVEWGTKQYFIPPFSLFLIKTFMYFGLPAEFAGTILNLIAGSLVPVAAYGICMEITRHQKAAFLSAFILALNVNIISISTEIQRDILYMCFIGFMIWMLCAGIQRKRNIYWLFAGILFAMSAITRYETFEFILIVAIMFAVLITNRPQTWKKNLVSCGVFFSSAILSSIILVVCSGTQLFYTSILKDYILSKL